MDRRNSNPMTHPSLSAARTHVPASIAQHGATLSQALLAELVALVSTTWAREQLRVRVTWALVIAIAVVGFLSAVVVDTRFLEIKVAVGAVALSVPALVRLVWGVLNRALLDAAAAETAIDRGVLTKAVEAMKRHVDAEEAVYDALYAPSVSVGRAR